MLRKAAHGRTDLFLPRRDVVMREVKCMGGVVRRDGASAFHVLPNAREAEGACCWHCCEPIKDARSVIPLPRLYDATEQVYHVYGRTCSPGCAKAYILEHTSFDRGHHLNTLARMLREVYGVAGGVAEAPPRPAMRRFGGVFDPSKQTRAECRLVEPPFVSYCMLVEERVGGGTAAPPEEEAAPAAAMEVEDEDALQEPMPPGLYEEFARTRAASSAALQAPPPVPPSKRKSGPAAASADGPMSKFLKG